MSRLRHTLILTIDVELDDQTDPESMVDVLRDHLNREFERSNAEYGIKWPLDWNLRHINEKIISTPDGGNDGGSSAPDSGDPT